MKTLITITGRTCSGKSTLEHDLLAEFDYHKATSHTTRKPRQGEVNGMDYYFVDGFKFNEFAEKGYFIENVFFNGNGYGITSFEINNLVEIEDKPVVLVVEPQGFKQIEEWATKNPDWNHIAIYLTATDARLASRFIYRSMPDLMTHETDKIATVANRMAAMMTEESTWDDFAKRENFFRLEYNENTKFSTLANIEAIVNGDVTAMQESA